MLLFPASLLVLVSPVIADNQPFPTAIRRQSPDSNEKILAEHLAFPSSLQVGPVLGSPSFLDDQALPSNGTARFYPAFAQHIDEREETILRRAAQALDLLQKRAACPAGMISCADSGSPNKCCQEGTYCTAVPDTDVGHVACCPNGLTCGGGVGKCPADATSCAAALGGGCCIPGYICQGIGCKLRRVFCWGCQRQTNILMLIVVSRCSRCFRNSYYRGSDNATPRNDDMHKNNSHRGRSDHRYRHCDPNSLVRDDHPDKHPNRRSYQDQHRC